MPRYDLPFLPADLTSCTRSVDSVKEALSGLLSRLHVLIIGPGLGREDYMQTFAKVALNIAKERGMYVVLDADGLYMVGQDISLIQGYRRAVLTPNVVEFKRLSENVVSVASHTCSSYVPARAAPVNNTTHSL